MTWSVNAFRLARQVYAILGTRVNDIEFEDCASLSIRMESGELVTSSMTLGASGNTSRLKFCFECLTADSGTLPYNPAEGDWQFTAREPYEQSRIDECIHSIATPHPWFTGFLQSVAYALYGDDSNAANLEDGRWSIEFVTAVYQSARTEKLVDLPISPDNPLYDG